MTFDDVVRPAPLARGGLDPAAARLRWPDHLLVAVGTLVFAFAVLALVGQVFVLPCDGVQIAACDRVNRSAGLGALLLCLGLAIMWLSWRRIPVPWIRRGVMCLCVVAMLAVWLSTRQILIEVERETNSEQR